MSRLTDSLSAMGYQSGYLDELLTYPDDEFLDEVITQRSRRRSWSLRERRQLEEQLAEHRAEVRTSDPSRYVERIHAAGPSRIVTQAEVEAIRDDLMARSLDAGYKSIA